MRDGDNSTTASKLLQPDGGAEDVLLVYASGRSDDLVGALFWAVQSG